MRSYLLGIALLLGSPALLGSTIYKYTDANGVVTYTDQRVQGAQVFLFRDRMVENNDRQVYVTTRKHAGGDTLVVNNDLYVPVEVELSITSAEHVLGAPSAPVPRGGSTQRTGADGAPGQHPAADAGTGGHRHPALPA